jgi:hypothetical protein
LEVVACTSCPFHDPSVQWTVKSTSEGFALTIGSEKDRICIVFTTEDIQQFFAQYAESQLAARAWLEPQEEPPDA